MRRVRSDMTAVDYGKTNWSQSVGGVCIKDGKVLLARQTYGKGKGFEIIPYDSKTEGRILYSL